MKTKNILLLLCLFFVSLSKAQIPDDFCYADSVLSGVKVELRYHSLDNFTGSIVDGYLSDRLIMTKESAEALKKVRNELKIYNLDIKIFDAYRPQKAVNHFIRWAKDLSDTLKKNKYYPEVGKSELFTKGYIAEKSGHSRGAAVDLTLISLNNFVELDMGSGFDLFSEKSWPTYQKVNAQARANRLLLRTIMEKYGFEGYDYEWWHFRLKSEPFPETYFDFDIR